MRLKELIDKVYGNVVNIKNDHIVTKITKKCQEVISGSIYFDIEGMENCMNAIKNGAETIISSVNYNMAVNNITSNNLNVDIGKFLWHYYYERLKNSIIIGITGTCGKTTTARIIFESLINNDKNVIIICTSKIISYYNKEKTITTTLNTTPDIEEIYKHITKQCYDYIIIEVSSEGIEKKRIFGIRFDYTIFLNLSNEHLDYHKNMKNYLQAKLKLFYQLKDDGIGIVNGKSEYATDFYQAISNKIVFFNDMSDHLKPSIIQTDLNKMIINIDGAKYETQLCGEYNLENILAARCFYMTQKLDENKFNYTIANMNKIEGRMNIFYKNQKYFIIDYAHTIEEVKNVLLFLNKQKKKKLIVVIGCGGSRDNTKRATIGKLCTSMADFVIFTEDNSRDEDVEVIVSDIISDVSQSNFKIIYNRPLAILEAIKISYAEDIIAILGKGAEDTIIRKNAIISFNDMDYLKEVLSNDK